MVSIARRIPGACRSSHESGHLRCMEVSRGSEGRFKEGQGRGGGPHRRNSVHISSQPPTERANARRKRQSARFSIGARRRNGTDAGSRLWRPKRRQRAPMLSVKSTPQALNGPRSHQAGPNSHTSVAWPRYRGPPWALWRGGGAGGPSRWLRHQAGRSEVLFRPESDACVMMESSSYK